MKMIVNFQILEKLKEFDYLNMIMDILSRKEIKIDMIR